MSWLACSIFDKTEAWLLWPHCEVWWDWKRECLRRTFLGSGTEEDQVQDGMEQCYREAFGSMVKATRLAQKQSGLSCCCEGSYALMRVCCDDTTTRKIRKCSFQWLENLTFSNLVGSPRYAIYGVILCMHSKHTTYTFDKVKRNPLQLLWVEPLSLITYSLLTL